MSKIIVVSGGFDPIHKGHIALFNSAKALGDKLVVALNSDKWLQRKKGRSFMLFEERRLIVRNLQMVDEVFSFNDNDNSAIDALKKVKRHYPDDTIVFANGGDRGKDNVPEQVVEGVEFAFSIGGDDKKNSSSDLIKNYKFGMSYEVFGYYNVLYNDTTCRVKEVHLDPGATMQMERHKKKSEFWFVAKGDCQVEYAWPEDVNKLKTRSLTKYMHFYVPSGQFHRIYNETKLPCKILVMEYSPTADVRFDDDCELIENYCNPVPITSAFI